MKILYKKYGIRQMKLQRDSSIDENDDAGVSDIKINRNLLCHGMKMK